MNKNNNGNGHKKLAFLETISIKMTDWVGTPWSLILHTLLFVGIFTLRHFGFSRDYVLLLLTTAVSLEAIYLSIFIQMSVNRATQSLEEVEEDIEDIQEDVDDDEEAHKVLIHIGQQMKSIQQDLEYLRRSGVLKTPGNTPRIRS
jgi:low affinity Fe/Cu permease